jgi:hypothetical protein
MANNSAQDRDRRTLVEGGSRALAKNGTTKWRLMLMGATCLIGVNLTVSQSVAQYVTFLPEPLPFTEPSPSDPSRLNIGVKCSNPHGAPGPWEVFIFSDKDGGGRCSSLEPGLYPISSSLGSVVLGPSPASVGIPNARVEQAAGPKFPGNFGIPNDWPSSVQVGKNVLVQLFRNDSFGGGRPLTVESGRACVPDNSGAECHVVRGIVNLEPLGWNEAVSSLRVEVLPGAADPPVTESCYLRSDFIPDWNTFVLLTKNDCINLPLLRENAPASFRSSWFMGIADDSLQSITIYHKDQPFDVCVFENDNFGGSFQRINHNPDFNKNIDLNPAWGTRVSSIKLPHGQVSSIKVLLNNNRTDCKS